MYHLPSCFRQEKKRPPVVDPSLTHELEPDTCALTSSLRKNYCPLPVSHQRYDDNPPSDTVYSWRGRNFNNEQPGDSIGCNTGTMVVTRNGSRGNVLEPQAGTYPRTMTKQPGVKGHDNLHVYEMPKWGSCWILYWCLFELEKWLFTDYWARV